MNHEATTEARQLIAGGEYRQALAVLENAGASIESTDPALLALYGWVLDRCGLQSEGLAAAERAFTLERNDLTVATLGDLLVGLGRHREARDIARTHEARTAELMHIECRILVAEQQFRRAQLLFEEILRLDPDDQLATCYVSYCRVRQTADKHAILNLELRFADGDILAGLLLVRFYRETSRVAAGMAIARQMYNRFPELPEAYYYLAWFLIADGQSAAASSIAVQAQNLFPDHIRLALIAAQSLTNTGRASEATQILADLATRHPGNLTVNKYLVKTLVKQRRWKDAWLAYKEIAFGRERLYG